MDYGGVLTARQATITVHESSEVKAFSRNEGRGRRRAREEGPLFRSPAVDNGVPVHDDGSEVEVQ